MKRKIFSTITLASCFAVCLAVTGGLAGKWKGSIKDDDGNDHQVHLVFNVDGEKLTGTAQAEGDPSTIDGGKIIDSNFSFTVKNMDGSVTPVDGKYIAAGDSVSLNFMEGDVKHHVTLVREGQ